MKNKIVFFTTIYPMNKSFVYDFFDSLLEQTYSEFDIVVVNDNYVNFELIIKRYDTLNIIEVPYMSTPSKNREYGINFLLENNYDSVIFGDIDDYFSLNRIEESLIALKYFDIVINDLTTFKDDTIFQKKYLSRRLNSMQEVTLEFILNKNVIGFGNSALNLKNLEKVSFPSDIIAVDWYFFSTLLLSGKKAVFINSTETFYRQYKNNTVGLGNNEVSEKSLINIYNIKKEHYIKLSKHDLFKKELIKLLEVDMKNICKYNKNLNFPLWWENI